MSGHTPGPWEVGRGAQADPFSIEAESRTVAHVKMGSLRRDRVDRYLADARLIAAAPEMLEALRAVLAHVEDENVERLGTAQCTLCHSYRQTLRAAIAKAEGDTP